MSKPRLILRPSAVRDMEECAVYLASRSPASSDRFLESCMSEFERLAEMPGMGSLRHFSNLNASGIRSWVLEDFQNYLVFYRPVEDGVEILRVLHGARDIDAIFE